MNWREELEQRRTDIQRRIVDTERTLTELRNEHEAYARALAPAQATGRDADPLATSLARIRSAGAL